MSSLQIGNANVSFHSLCGTPTLDVTLTNVLISY